MLDNNHDCCIILYNRQEGRREERGETPGRPGNSSWESLAEPSPEQPRPPARFLPREKCGSWQLWRLGDLGGLAVQEKIFKFTERWRLARPQRQQAGWLADWSESESECEEEDLPDIRWWLPPVTRLLLLYTREIAICQDLSPK